MNEFTRFGTVESNINAVATSAVMQSGRAVQEQEEKPYSLRGLCAKDIMPMVQIIRKIGLKDIGRCFDAEEIKAITDSMSDAEKETSVEDIAETVGITVVLKIVDVVLENLSEAEQEIFSFLASLSGMTTNDVSNLSMDVFFEMLVDVLKAKEFMGFTKVVSKLLK